MAMLGGFNPETGTFEDIKPVIEIPRNTSTQTSYTFGSGRKQSLFSRFNEAIEDIGNWFADHADTVLGWMSMITMGLIVLSGIVTVICSWISEGFWMALLTAVIALIVCGIALTVASIVITIVVNIVMYAFRLIFWNGWTLLIALALCGGGLVYSSMSKDSKHITHVEAIVPQYDRYQCTAKVLNIRQYPTKNSKVIGTIKKGEIIEVKEINNGFALFNFKDKEGYASLQYLTKVN